MMNYLDLSQHSFGIAGSNHLRFVLFIFLYFTSIVSSADIGKYFTRSPQSIVAPPGDRVTFQCETNIPAEQVRWKLNGRFLHPANETDIRITGTFLYVKVSKNRDRFIQQVGDYQCVVEFGAEARGQNGRRQVAVALTSVPAQLSIAQIDGFQNGKRNTTLEVVEGNTVAIQCDAPYSNPSPIIQFFKDGQSIESETGNAIVMDSGVLHLHNVSTIDTGNYGCSATNHITSDTFMAGWITRLVVKPRASSVRKPPEFLVKPKPYFVVPQDGNVTLECVAVGNPPPYTTWRKLRAPTMTNFQSIKGNLHLYNIGFSQEGEYICEAFNGVGESLTTLSTIVLNSMPNITKEPTNLVVEEDGEAILDCSTEGLPKPRVYWVFNGENVHENGNIQMTDTGLRIAHVEKRHAGLFQCFATNPMGTVSSPAELKVMPKQITAMASDSRDLEDKVSSMSPPVTRHFHHHKGNKFHRGKHNKRKHKGQDMIPPSKPIMNRISDESIMVRWSVPPNNGYPIQFFKIQYKEVNKRNSRWMTIEEDIPPHIHSFEIKDFRVGHTYRFRIAAVYSNNDNKVGPNSDKFILQKDASMRRPISAPTISTALPNNTTSVLLRWKYTKTETGGLDGYFIHYRESTTADEYSKMTVLGSTTESAYITHLKPGTSYDIKVQAFNKAGASNFSAIIPARTFGSPTSDKPDEHIHKKEVELTPSDDDIPPPSDHLYVLLGCIFAGFWIFLCVACALCYKCKQKKAEEDAKYPCEASGDIEAKGIPNGHIALNGHPRNGYIPTIAAHLELDEKETSFVERHNNNRPISPSQLNSSVCELGSFSSTPTQMDTKSWTELKTLRTEKEMIPNSNSKNNSLQRKKHHQVIAGNGGSLRRGNYTSCSSEDLDAEPGEVSGKDSKIFPKEHYKVSRKHSLSRKRNSMVDG